MNETYNYLRNTCSRKHIVFDFEDRIPGNLFAVVHDIEEAPLSSLYHEMDVLTVAYTFGVGAAHFGDAVRLSLSGEEPVRHDTPLLLRCGESGEGGNDVDFFGF